MGSGPSLCLICISVMTSDTEYLVMPFLTIRKSSLVKYLLYIFLIFVTLIGIKMAFHCFNWCLVMSGMYSFIQRINVEWHL